MTETGWLPYDLAGNWCEECGRAKSFRLWPGVLTGCKTCDEVVTRHRCVKLPAVTDRVPGQNWECPDCGSDWLLVSEEQACPDCCDECGHTVTTRRWDLAEEGDRIGSAPRHKPEQWTPLRNALRQTARARPVLPSLPGECYTMSNGSAVHVRPGCRCR